MSGDELLLLVRSYADQVARRHDGITTRCDVYDEDFGALVEVCFTGSDASAARDACSALITDDQGLALDEDWEDEKGAWLSVVDAAVADQLDGRDYDDVDPPAEELELRDQLDMLEGPIAVLIPEFPECQPNRATKVVVVGLRLEGKGWAGEPYWKGDFADLERAQYWALKREREYKSKGYRASASVYWQHETSEETVVKRILEVMNTGK
jgi:hypothetical protein